MSKFNLINIIVLSVLFSCNTKQERLGSLVSMDCYETIDLSIDCRLKHVLKYFSDSLECFEVSRSLSKSMLWVFSEEIINREFPDLERGDLEYEDLTDSLFSLNVNESQGAFPKCLLYNNSLCDDENKELAVMIGMTDKEPFRNYITASVRITYPSNVSDRAKYANLFLFSFSDACEEIYMSSTRMFLE